MNQISFLEKFLINILIEKPNIIYHGSVYTYFQLFKKPGELLHLLFILLYIITKNNMNIKEKEKVGSNLLESKMPIERNTLQRKKKENREERGKEKEDRNKKPIGNAL